MKKHLLRIFYQIGRWKVKPGRPHVNKGHKVTWKTNARATLWFPDKKLFGRNHLIIPKGGKRTLKVRTGQHGHYPYSVYCRDHRCFAVAGSDPEIIVP